MADNTVSLVLKGEGSSDSYRAELTFAKLPRILCLHLKRFDALTNKKITNPVSFPVELDMGPHLPHW